MVAKRGRQKGKITNLLTVPSPATANKLVSLADWVEIRALLESDGKASQEDLVRALDRAYSIGETNARSLSEEVFEELADRHSSCKPSRPSGGAWGYPFELNKSGDLLSLRSKAAPRTRAGILYLFLLVATRADMDSERRKLDGLDPTAIFERLCADILLNFWGGKTKFSGSIVFGTAQREDIPENKFKSKIESLCQSIREGRGLREGAKPPGAGDGKLDIAVWRVFSDGRAGGLVGFAQCKTGIHWKDHLPELQPRHFCRNFFQKPLLIDPLKVYMVPHRVNGTEWDSHTSLGGLLFDRCRLIQYGLEISDDVFKDCRAWLSAALLRQRERKFAI